MIAKLLISSSLSLRASVIGEELKKNNLTKKHPDLLYFEQNAKLGIAEARKIKEHFSLRPYSGKGRGVVLEDALSLTIEAQNALLKTLEELPRDAVLILGASSDANLLATILSRCQIIRIQNLEFRIQKHQEDIERLLVASLAERFEYVEKIKNREEFLQALLVYFHNNLLKYPEFTKQLLQAEEWAKQNVNIRAVLEYSMLVMPVRKW